MRSSENHDGAMRSSVGEATKQGVRSRPHREPRSGVAIQEIAGLLTVPWIAASAFGLLATTPRWKGKKFLAGFFVTH